MQRAWVSAFVGIVLSLLSMTTARAELRVSAAPVMGANTPINGAWIECVVRIENDGPRLEQGEVEIRSAAGYGVNDELRVTTTFAVSSGAAVNVRLPTRVFVNAGGSLLLVVTNEAGEEVATTTLPTLGSAVPFLLDATEPPRLAGALRDAPTLLSFDPGNLPPRTHASGRVNVATGGVRLDTSTGDPVLPDRAAGYAAATLVVMRTDQLSRLTGMQLDALANYVLSGGTLALAVARPEDLRSEPLISMTGGEIKTVPVSRALRRMPAEKIPDPDDRGSGGGDPDLPGKLVTPGSEVDKDLVGYSGGNLRPTLFGAGASYGLGEVHVLAFDPTQAPGVDDAWVKSRMLQLLTHAWERRRHLIVPHGTAFPDEYQVGGVFKLLDPNQSSRWAIIVAALLLLVYSVLAGPINFTRAARQQRPLRALWILPVMSSVTFFLMVFLGIFAKGWSGKARHLTLIEAASGMSKASACRYRAFFTSNSRKLTIRASDLSSVLDTVTVPRAGAKRALRVDRDGVQLVGLSTIPWETLVIREDGFASLGAGVSITRDEQGGMVVTNRVARDLRAVIAIEPATVRGGERNVYFFSRIRDGESKRMAEGVSMAFKPWRVRSSLTEVELEPIRHDLEKESKGLVAAWAAIGATVSNQVNWWPEDVPVVLAQMEGGEGYSSDAGLGVDMDRVLIRVVGWGGVP